MYFQTKSHRVLYIHTYSTNWFWTSQGDYKMDQKHLPCNPNLSSSLRIWKSQTWWLKPRISALPLEYGRKRQNQRGWFLSVSLEYTEQQNQVLAYFSKMEREKESAPVCCLLIPAYTRSGTGTCTLTCTYTEAVIRKRKFKCTEKNKGNVIVQTILKEQKSWRESNSLYNYNNQSRPGGGSIRL